jgi:signal transduction histidine kinase
MSENIIIITLAGSMLTLIIALIFMYFRFRNNVQRYDGENGVQRENLEKMVRERTRNLESVRDSLSEYAVQKFELAQELELKNQQINRQKDDLFKKSESLRTAYAEIKKLDAFRQQMARMLIHDLKNPLNVIMNIVDNQQLSGNSVAVIKMLSWEMLDLIMNILEVNRLESSQMNVNFSSYDLSANLKLLNEKYSFLIQHSMVQLKDEIISPCVVLADKKLTERVIDNLLSNAFRFTPSGGMVKLCASDDEDRIRIEVSDTGQGIPVDIREVIFSEYTRGEDQMPAYKNSTGIGLAFCKLAIEAQGGKIGILSAPDGGTTVWFTLMKGDNSSMTLSEDTERSGEIQPLSSDLTDEDISDAQHQVLQLEAVEISEISTIYKILSNSVFESNSRLQRWRDEMKICVYDANADKFKSLISLFDIRI